MRASKHLQYKHGFSIIELMVVISIGAVLTLLSVIQFKALKLKAATAEAKLNLPVISTLQHSYHAEHGEYLPIRSGPSFSRVSPAGRPAMEDVQCDMQYNSDELGFKLANCQKSRYYYMVNMRAPVPDPQKAFEAEAVSSIGGSSSRIGWFVFSSVTQYGNPIMICPTINDSQFRDLGYFQDRWLMDHDGILTHDVDAADHCL